MARIIKAVFTIIFLPLLLIMGIFIKILQTLGMAKQKTWIDEIDNRKAMANLLVLEHGSYEVAESYSRFKKYIEPCSI